MTDELADELGLAVSTIRLRRCSARALRPSPVRPWTPGDWWRGKVPTTTSCVLVPDLPDVRGFTGVVCATTDVGFVARWDLDEDEMTLATKPRPGTDRRWFDAWVAAGRPGAVEDEIERPESGPSVEDIAERIQAALPDDPTILQWIAAVREGVGDILAENETRWVGSRFHPGQRVRTRRVRRRSVR